MVSTAVYGSPTRPKHHVEVQSRAQGPPLAAPEDAPVHRPGDFVSDRSQHTTQAGTTTAGAAVPPRPALPSPSALLSTIPRGPLAPPDDELCGGNRADMRRVVNGKNAGPNARTRHTPFLVDTFRIKRGTQHQARTQQRGTQKQPPFRPTRLPPQVRWQVRRDRGGESGDSKLGICTQSQQAREASRSLWSSV